MAEQERAVAEPRERILERLPAQLVLGGLVVERAADDVRDGFEEADVRGSERASIARCLQEQDVAPPRALRHGDADGAAQSVCDPEGRTPEPLLLQQIVAHDGLVAEQRVTGLRRVDGHHERRIGVLGGLGDGPHAAVAQPPQEARVGIEHLAHATHGLIHQRLAVEVERPPPEVRDRRLLPLRAPLFGHVLELGEEVRLRPARLDERDGHDGLHRRPVRTHVALDERRVVAADGGIGLVPAQADVVGVGELEDRPADERSRGAAEEVAERRIDPQDAQIARQGRHPDRGVLEPLQIPAGRAPQMPRLEMKDERAADDGQDVDAPKRRRPGGREARADEQCERDGQAGRWHRDERHGRRRQPRVAQAGQLGRRDVWVRLPHARRLR